MKLPKLVALCTGKCTEDDTAAATNEYREAFDMIDLNKDGLVSAAELQAYYSKLGANYSLREVEGMIATVDTNKNGMVDFSEFFSLLLSHVKEEELRKAFQAYDTDGSGKISRRELAAFFMKHDSKLSDAEVSDLMADLDANKDGEIDFEEFRKMMADI